MKTRLDFGKLDRMYRIPSHAASVFPVALAI
jgi:hypothetical protein